MTIMSATFRRSALALTLAGASALALSGCQWSRDFRAQNFPTAKSISLPEAPAQSALPASAGLDVRQYSTVRDFKAVANAGVGTFGASGAEQSLVTAEREAIKACTANSRFQGECKITRIGDTLIDGLSDDQRTENRWKYMKVVHERQAQFTPLNQRLPIKALIPGSTVVDGTLFLAGGYTGGGYAQLQFDDQNCTGGLDPIEPRTDAEPDPDRRTVGIMEFACNNGKILRGGYVLVDNANQLFFLEDDRSERWDFIASVENVSVGNNLRAFKQLFRKIERDS